MATKRTPPSRTSKKKNSKPATRRSWTSFDRAAKRVLTSFRLGDRHEGRAFLEESGLSIPDDLLRLAVSIDDGARIDLEKLGGAATQDLFDVAGLIDANHREEGGFGYRVAAGEVPEGLVMFGYGTHQLLYDTLGALGSVGAIWSCQDQDVTEAKKLADSLEALLAGATPLVVDAVEPPPPPKVKLMPTPPPFAAPREDSGLFSATSEAPVGWHLVQRGTELWFRGKAGELSAFDLVTEQWTSLRALPAGFEIPSALVLRDGSVLLFPWNYANEKHRCVRGDGRSEWVEVASLPAEAAVDSVGRGVLPDGRVLIAGGRAIGGGDDAGSWSYDPARDQWSPGPALPEAAAFQRTLFAANGPHFVSDDGERYLPRVFSLDDGGQWQIARSPESASGFAEVSLSDGRHALVMTGERDAACLVYDPLTRTLRPLPALPITRSTPAACELAPGILGSVRKLGASERELLATLRMSDAEWRAGPLIPAGYTAHLLRSHGERVFLFCLTQVPGSDFPERNTTVFVASSMAVVG